MPPEHEQTQVISQVDALNKTEAKKMSKQESNHHDSGDTSHHNESHQHGKKEGMMPLFSPPKQRQRWGDHQKHPHTE
jgi:hypothetical protein